MADGAEVELENVSESPPITQSQINQDHSIYVNEDPQNEAERCMSTSRISEESGCPMTVSVNRQENSTTLHDDLPSTNRGADLAQEYGNCDQIHANAGFMTGNKPPDQCISNDPVGRQNIFSNGDDEQTELKMICEAESKDNKSVQRDLSNRVSEMETVIPTVSCDETGFLTEHNQNLERTPTGPMEEDHMNANTVTFESQGSTSKEDYAYRNDSDIPNNMHDQEPYSSYNSTCANAPSHDEKEDTEGSVGKDQTNAKRDASSQPQVSTSKKVNAYRNDSDILDVKCDQELVPTDLSSNASELSHNETEDTEGSVAKVHTNAERDSLESQVSTSNGVNTNENDSHIPNEKHDQHHVPIDTSSNASQLSHNKTEDTEGSLQESTNAHKDNLKSQISTSKAANAYVYNSGISSDIRGPELLPPDLSSNVNELSNNETEDTEGSVEKGQMNVKRDTLLKNEMSTSTEVNTNGNDSGIPNDKHDRHHLPTDLSCNASQLSHNKPDDKEGSVEKGQTNAKRDALLHSQVSTSKEVHANGKESDISNGNHGQDIFPSGLSSNASGLSHNETKDKEAVVCEPGLIRNEQSKTVIMEESSKLEVQEENELHNGNFVYQPCEDVSTEKERNIAPCYKGSKRLKEGASVAFTDGKGREISLFSRSPEIVSHFRKYASKDDHSSVCLKQKRYIRDDPIGIPYLSHMINVQSCLERRQDADYNLIASDVLNGNLFIRKLNHEDEFSSIESSEDEIESSLVTKQSNDEANNINSEKNQMEPSKTVSEKSKKDGFKRFNEGDSVVFIVEQDREISISGCSLSWGEPTGKLHIRKNACKGEHVSVCLKQKRYIRDDPIGIPNSHMIYKQRYQERRQDADCNLIASDVLNGNLFIRKLNHENEFNSIESSEDEIESSLVTKLSNDDAHHINSERNQTEPSKKEKNKKDGSRQLNEGDSVVLSVEQGREISIPGCSISWKEPTVKLHIRKNACEGEHVSVCLRQKMYIRDDPIGIPNSHMIYNQRYLERRHDILNGNRYIRRLNHEEEFNSNGSSGDEIDPSLVSKQINYEAHHNSSERNQTELSKKDEFREGHVDDTDDLLQSALADFHRIVDQQKKAVIISSFKQQIADCLPNNINDK